MTYDDVQITERYQNVSGLARGLLRDFREVESNFRAITQQIYQQQSAAGHTKGSLLGLALDALDALRETPQGIQGIAAFYQQMSLRLAKERWGIISRSRSWVSSSRCKAIMVRAT